MRLERRKLKVWGSSPWSGVYVWQDDAAPDGDATELWTDAFDGGANLGNAQSRADYVVAEPLTLRNSYDDGASFRFRLFGRGLKWDTSHPNMPPNSVVEFWAKRPEALLAIGGEIPPWHINEQGQDDQVRLFRGWVDTREQDGTAIIWEARDAVWRADDILLQKSISGDPGVGDVTVPKVVFNADPDSDDYFFSVKILDPTGGAGSFPAVLGTGMPPEPADSRATVGEILHYLETAYQGPLTTQDIWPESGSLFDPSDLLELTVRPDEIILENARFGEAVKELLRWVPDRRLMVDHQTGQWRILAVAKALEDTTIDAQIVGANFDSLTPTGSPQGRINMTGLDPADFALLGVGQRWRIFHAPMGSEEDTVGPELNEEFVIQSIQGTPAFPVIWTEALLSGTTGAAIGPVYGLGSTITKVDPQALPTVGLNVDTSPRGGVNLSNSLVGSAGAVKVWSIFQKTERKTIPWSPGLSLGNPPDGFARPGWDPSYESTWDPQDEDRTLDYGASGGGMEVFKIQDNTGVDGRFWVFIPYDESAYGNNHAPVDEWQGTTLWAWTSGLTFSRQQNVTWTVDEQTVTSDIGDGRSGLVLKVTARGADLDEDNGGTFFTVDDDGQGDRVVLTQDESFSTTTARNRRWEVGRKWSTTETIYRKDGNPHTISCQATQIRAWDGSLGSSRPSNLLPPGVGLPGRNLGGFPPSTGPWQQLAGGGLGSFQVYRFAGSGYTQKPISDPSVLQRYAAPKTVEMTLEETTTEIREARWPASGFAGHAYLMFGLEREISFTSRTWQADNQTPDYENLVRRLHDVHQRAHQQGTVSLFGIQEWGSLKDLGLRARLLTGTVIPGGNNGLTSFWGPVSSCELDFASDQVRVDFDTRSALADVALQVWERSRVREADRISALEQRLAKLGATVNCLNLPPAVTAPGTDARSIRQGGRNPAVAPGPPKDEITLGMAPSGMGIAQGAAAAAAAGGGYVQDTDNHYDTHGPNAEATVFRDMLGQRFFQHYLGWAMPVGVSGARAIPNAASEVTPHGIPQENAANIMAGMAAALGLTIPSNPQARFAVVRDATNGANTVLTIAAPSIPAGVMYDGGTVEILDFLPDTPRPPYDITNVAGGGLVTLDGVISEPLPETPAVCIVHPPLPIRPDPDDFPDGGTPAQDSAGEWVVISPTGVIQAAVLNPGLRSVSADAGTGSPAVAPRTVDTFQTSGPIELTIARGGADPADEVLPQFTARFGVTEAIPAPTRRSGIDEDPAASSDISVPAGYEMLVIGAQLDGRASSAIGTYELEGRMIDVTDGIGITEYPLCTATAAASQPLSAGATGDLASPLATLPAGRRFLLELETGASNPEPLALQRHSIRMVYVLRPVS